MPRRRHFLVRGFDKVRGEWSLMALCYNFTRVLNILGLEAFVARMAKLLARLQCAPAAALQCIQFVLAAFWTYIEPRLAISRLAPAPAPN